jgi:hypothetical protein
MIGANQFLAANTTRDYPFVIAPDRSASERAWLADAAFVITVDAEIYAQPIPLVLSNIVVSTGVGFRFEIPSGPLAGWAFVSTPQALDDLQRVSVAFVDPSDVAHSEMGYGYIIVGIAAELPVVTTGVTIEVVASTIRLLESSRALRMWVANTPCLGDSVFAETPGATRDIAYTGVTSTTIPGCVEIGLYPPGSPSAGNPLPQVAVTPDPQGHATADIPIVPPSVATTELATGAVTTISLHDAMITDALPADPGFDAEVTEDAIVGGAEVAEGYNIDLGYDSPSGITIKFRLGGGDGFSCDPISGCSPGTKAVNTVKSLNGVHSESLTLVAGTDVEVLASELDHRIYLVFNAERLKGAAT